jgi:type VII secretion protein EccE
MKTAGPKNPMLLSLRLSTGHLLVAAVLTPALILLFARNHLLWVGISLAVLIWVVVTVAVRGRRLSGWIAALYAWRRRHRTAPDAPGEASVGATVMPGDHVAVRWQGTCLVALIELVPRPYTPSVIVGTHCYTDDTVNTQHVEDLLTGHCPDLEADVVSAGYRVGKTAPASVVALYEQVIGPTPAPAHRRTWIVLRADPGATRRSAQRRGSGVAGLAGYLVASATRIADQLASAGVDARCARSFDDFDTATDVAFEHEAWSYIKGHSTFTTAYTAPGGPDVWWSARADHTITRVRVRPGTAPTTTILLTTLANPTTPRGFSCLFGGQRAALHGTSPVTDRHYELPIGSAGILIGETLDHRPVFLPFDDVDTQVVLTESQVFTQFMVRSAAAGASITVDPRMREFGGTLNARLGQELKLAWPTATTYVTSQRRLGRVTIHRNYLDTPRHRKLPLRLVQPREESRYQMTLGQN